MKVTHEFEEMTIDKRPQDNSLDGEGWTYKNLEHGGAFPDTMPQAIRATDADGKSCIYIPIQHNGKIVDSKGFYTELPRVDELVEAIINLIKVKGRHNSEMAMDSLQEALTKYARIDI